MEKEPRSECHNYIKGRHDCFCVFISFCPCVDEVFVLLFFFFSGGGDGGSHMLGNFPQDSTVVRGQHQTSFISCRLDNVK